MPKRSVSAMLDCQDGEKEGDNCTHCHTESGDCRLYWGIQLDQDLLETIFAIYPEWFKDCNNSGSSSSNNSMNLAVTRGGNGIEPKTIKPTIIPLSSNNDVENTSLQKTLEKNKESLKVKLMLRRPINELIERGILPSLKSPSAFHEQRQKMERVKMGDLLNGKIQSRPERQVFLQQQHLPDSKETEASLQEKQKQKKARFVDASRTSEHSGSFKLIKGNILEADEVLAQVVREGSINFHNLSEDSLSLLKIVKEENDTGSDCASPSPPYNFSEHSQESFPSLEASDMSPIPLTNAGSPSSARTSFSVSPPSSGSSPLSLMPCVVSSPTRPDQIQHQDFILNGLLLQNKDTPVKGSRKKAKPKSQPKARTIKFHEYKGPPNAQKNNTQSSATNTTTNNSSTETSYDLLLQQQQLFLQWQLEWQQKYPQSVLPQGAQVAKGDQSTQSNHVPASSTNSPLPQSESPPSPQKVITKLEDLKVSDLKAELKKRNLPVSGPKPILIERLKIYAESNKSTPLPGTSSSVLPSTSATTEPSSEATGAVGGILMDTISSIPTAATGDISDIFHLPTVANSDLSPDIYCALESTDNQQPTTVLTDPSVRSVPMDIDSTAMCSEAEAVVETSTTLLTNEDIVQFQQRYIDKLQMELQKSQMQLQHNSLCQQQEAVNVQSSLIEEGVATTSTTANLLMNTSSSAPITTSATDATGTITVPTSTTVETIDPVDTKSRQRQLIHQQLQQKIHQQIQHLQQQRTKKHAKNNEVANKPPGANSTLTALLESDPINSPLNISMGSVSAVTDVGKSIDSSSPSYRVDAFGQLKSVDSDLAPLFMNSPPVANISTSHPTSCTTETTSLSNASKSNTPAHRTSSLPSFSAFVNKKPLTTRSNTDPLFHISKPPPNYSEATRQLSKMKQQMLQANEFGSNSTRQPKKHKTSVKSQAVDDVLEILIKNGELPPSAAQEPQLSRAPINAKKEHLSSPMFQTTVANGLCTNNAVSLVSPTMPAPCESDPQQHNVNLHMSSLQSVLDMTPPSSAGFGETNNNTPTSLDFDFHLDMEDIEVMDLETLPQEEHHVTDRHLPTDICKFRTTNNLNACNPLLQANRDSLTCSNKSMDADILEWLELLDDSSRMQFPGVEPIYPTTNEHDPMLSNIANGHDSMDIFGVDDIEFKTNDVSILSWDKSDFGT